MRKALEHLVPILVEAASGHALLQVHLKNLRPELTAVPDNNIRNGGKFPYHASSRATAASSSAAAT